MSDRDTTPSAGNDKIGPKDGRSEWERPALHRLDANEAQMGNKTHADGSFPGEHS
jgi:hypothetical protein